MDNARDQERRQSFLLVFYLAAVCGALFLLLFALCGGMIIYMALTAIGMAVFALAHWWLWGHSFTRAVAAEQAPEEPAPTLEPPPANEDPYRGRY